MLPSRQSTFWVSSSARILRVQWHQGTDLSTGIYLNLWHTCITATAFAPKTKDKAAKRSSNLYCFCESWLDCSFYERAGEASSRKPTLVQKVNIYFKKNSAGCDQTSNGEAEWICRTLLNMARSMIFACRTPLSFWNDAVKYASPIIHRILTSAKKSLRYRWWCWRIVSLIALYCGIRSAFSVHCDSRKNELVMRCQVKCFIEGGD